MIGKTVSHYRILEKLGEGGMGVVYKAEDTKLKRTVAIKFLPRQIAASDEERERFKIEAQASAALNHPNIATIHAIEEHDDELFIVMEYIEGEELTNLTKPQRFSKVIEIAIQIAEGLQAAHEKGIIHRDIKASNIMITDKGQIKIMDFGLARMSGQTLLTKTGTTLGTVAYMSPEQARGEKLDQRTDIWSFGVVLYEMLTGQRPFHGDYEQAVVYAIMNEPPTSIAELCPDIPKALAEIIGKALAKQPEARYQSAERMVTDLRKVRDKLQAKEMSTKESDGETRRSPVGWVLAALGVFLLIAITFVLWPESDEGGADARTYRSIAVLPFSDLSPTKDQEYFCDGMTEEIITKLAHLQDLKVIARTSVMRYKQTDKSVEQIGDELDVETVLEGSVRKSGDNIRVTAQLIKTEDESHIWANNYDRKLQNIFALQDEVAREIARALHLQLTPQKVQALEKGPEENLSAYDLVMRGRHQLSEFNLDHAMALLDQALSIDSTYVPAYVGKARTWHLRWVLSGFKNQEALRQKKRFAEKAIALAPDDPEAISMLASAYLTSNEDNDTTYRALQRALSENPNSYWTLETAAFFCITRLGALEQGIRYFYEIIERDPYTEPPYGLAAERHIQLGEWEKAAALLKRLQPFAPDHLSYINASALLAIHQRNLEKADSLVARTEKINVNLARFYQAYLLAARGQKEAALELYQDAGIYMLLGMHDEALTDLQDRAEHPSRSYYQYLTRYPLFEPLRDDPRFITLVQKERKKLQASIQKYGDIFLNEQE